MFPSSVVVRCFLMGFLLFCIPSFSLHFGMAPCDARGLAGRQRTLYSELEKTRNISNNKIINITTL